MRSKLSWKIRFVLGKVQPHCFSRKSTGRILCLLDGGLGDKLMALPAVRHLRAEFPDKELTVAFTGIQPPYLEGEADRLLAFSSGVPWRKALIAARRFDVCFVNSIGVFDIWSEIAAFICGGIDLRGPCPDAGCFGRTVYSRPYAFGTGHETVVNLRGAGGETNRERISYGLKLSPKIGERGERSAVIHPGSSAAGKKNRWGTSNFADVAQELNQSGFEVMLVGSGSESELLAEIQSLTQAPVKIAMDLPLERLAIILASADIVIANDSGIGHLAASVGARVISVMGPTRPERVAPVGDVTVLGSRCPRGGCYWDADAIRCDDCVNLVSVEEVLRAAFMALGRKKSPTDASTAFESEGKLVK